MRHRFHGRHLNRDSEHRTAMFRNLAAGLFEHGEIRTTMAKAKAVQPFVEKIITIAKRGGLQSRRRIESMINDRRIHAWVADPAVGESKKDNPYFELPDAEDITFNRYGELKKAPRLVQHIMAVIAPMFADRDGGYTRIVKIDAHRLGDGTDYVLLQLVGQEEGPQISGRKSTRRAIADKRTAFAAKLRKEKGGTTAVDAHAEPAPAQEAHAEPAAAVAAVAEAEPPAEAEAPAESGSDESATDEKQD